MMDARLEQEPRQRSRQQYRERQTMQARQDQIQEIVKQQQATSIILERVMGRLESLERWQETEERARERAAERRDDRMEKQPDTVRTAFESYGGCLGQIVVTLISGISTLVAITALIITLRR